MRKVYHAILPSKADSFEIEWNQCLQQLKKLQNSHLKLFKATVFIDTHDDQDYFLKQATIRQSIQSHFGHHPPAFTVLAEAPETPFSVAVEAGLVDASLARLYFKTLKETSYAVIESPRSKEVWATGLGNRWGEMSIERSAIEAFEQMKLILEAEGLSFNHIVRQWNYIARIVDFDNVGEDRFQHYQIFNEIRNQYYRKYRTVKGYPAATGIGTRAGGVSIDFCANYLSDEKQAVSIQNPEQANPYLYDQDELIGSVLTGKTCKQAPQFERAKLILTDCSTLYVSGTASIIGQKTIGLNDIELQTRTTIDNILKLSSPDNLQKQAEINILIPNRICIFRTYIKYPEHFNVVKQICKEKFGSTPAVYVVADICREDLLVEIEAEFAN